MLLSVENDGMSVSLSRGGREFCALGLKGIQYIQVRTLSLDKRRCAKNLSSLTTWQDEIQVNGAESKISAKR